MAALRFYPEPLFDIRPSWYPDLVAGARPVFQTDSPASLAADHENMAVYPLPIP